MAKIINVILFVAIVGGIAIAFADPSELVNPLDFKYSECRLVKTTSGDVVMCHVQR